MRAVVQRVLSAQVSVNGAIVGAIDQGLLVLLGIGQGDSEQEADWLADKVCGLRVFADDTGKMGRALADVDGSLLVVSQFTLWGHVGRGLRPDFQRAASRAHAEPLYVGFLARCRHHRVVVATGEFGAHMAVQLVNDGPVTLMIDTDDVMPSGK